MKTTRDQTTRKQQVTTSSYCSSLRGESSCCSSLRGESSLRRKYRDNGQLRRTVLFITWNLWSRDMYSGSRNHRSAVILPLSSYIDFPLWIQTPQPASTLSLQSGSPSMFSLRPLVPIREVFSGRKRASLDLFDLFFLSKILRVSCFGAVGGLLVLQVRFTTCLGVRSFYTEETPERVLGDGCEGRACEYA